MTSPCTCSPPAPTAPISRRMDSGSTAISSTRWCSKTARHWRRRGPAMASISTGRASRRFRLEVTSSTVTSCSGRSEMASLAKAAIRIAIFALIAATWLSGAQAMAADGLVTVKSAFGPGETMQRLEAEVKAKGMTVFAHVDHAAGAAAVGMKLRPTDLLVFGAAKGGTPLMQSVQTIGIDLPLKALVWQDAAGVTWLSYNDPAWLAKSHGGGPR